MAKATQVFYIDLGGSLANVGAIRYGFRGREDNYDNIGKAMGVNKAKDTTQGVVFGCNRPKPVAVRINYRTGTASGVGFNGAGIDTGSNSTRSTTRWAEPDKLGDLTLGGVINGKKIKINGKEFDINSVSPVGASR